MDKDISDLYNDGQIDQAIHLLVKKIDEHPKQIDGYLQLSTYLLEQGSFEQAQQLLEQAQHLVAKPQELSYNLAVCYYMQGEFSKALNLLDAIPNDDLVLYQKALVYLKLGQYQKALAYAMTIKQTDARKAELLADIWLSLGNTSEAEKSLVAIPKQERSAKVNFMLGVAVLETDPDRAELYFDLAKKKDPKYYQHAKKQYEAIVKLISDQRKENHD